MENDLWHLKILLADDNQEFRSTLATLLRTRNCLVDEAECGEQAWKLLCDFDYDLVISEIQMPDGDGVWLLAKITTTKLPLPVILMNGNTSVTRDDVVSWGAVALLQKPFVTETLSKAINQSVRKRNKALEDEFELPIKKQAA